MLLFLAIYFVLIDPDVFVCFIVMIVTEYNTEDSGEDGVECSTGA